MTKTTILIFFAAFCCCIYQAEAQGILNKLKKKAEEKLKKKADQTKENIKQKAEDTFEARLDQVRNSYDSTNFNYAIALSDNAGLFEDTERFRKQQKLLLGLSDGLGVTENSDPLHKAKGWNELGQMAYANHRFKRAEFSFKQSKQEFEYQQETHDIVYPKVVANIGLLYHTMGRYTEAETYTQQALQLRKEIMGLESVAYAASLNNKAMLYRDLGKYNEAENLFQESLQILAKAEGGNSASYAIVLNNQAMLFQTVGRYEQAEKMLTNALEIAKQSMREKSNNYQKLLVNLALLYQEMKQYEKAESIYTRAVNLKEKRIGTRNHPDLAHMLDLLASLYMEMGKQDQVKSLLEEALRIYEKKFGKQHPAYATTLSHLGNFHRVQGATDKAVTMLKAVLETRRNTLGEKHPNCTRSEEDLALVYWQQGNYKEAGRLYRKVLQSGQQFIQTYFPPMSETEKEKYWDQLRPSFLRFYSFVANFYTKDPSLLTEMYEAHLATKAILLNSTNKIKSKILSSNNKTLINNYQKWVARKELLAKLYTFSKEELKEQGINRDSLEIETNTLEKKISANVPELFEKKITYQDILSKLGTGEASLDLIHFNYFDKQFTDKIYYAALIASKSTRQPKLVVLENGDELDGKYFKYYRNMIKTKKDDKYSYAQYWARLEDALTGTQKIYASLDGVYNQISLNTLRKPDGAYLVDNYSFVFLTNTKDLLEHKKQNNKYDRSAILVGFPDYGGSGKLSPLPGTKQEVDNIHRILANKQFKVNKFLAKEAKEYSIKNVKNPRIIHIATHGFFLNDVVNTGNNKVFGIEIDKAKENPLLRAGLMLADAEKTMGDINTKETNDRDNGVLTAFEAMNMSLENTELVILSACETGLGDVKAGEGVYGLQRAFQVAGADAMIMSLWTVSDAATQELMTLFYQNWLSSGNKITAFKKAQLQLKTKYTAPYYWGGFVMIGR